MRDKEMRLSKLQLFLKFIKADKRCLPQFKEEQKRKGIPVGELDFPLLRYTFSLNDRLRMLTILRNDIHNLNKEAIEEMKRTQEKGYGTNEKDLILTVYYESFLNQIYNIMENLAKINLFMFDANINPKHGFSDQMKKIKEGILEFHPDYDKLIKEEMDWYMEVHRIRSNTNHYMVGMNVFGRTEDEEWIPQYMNFNISERFSDNDFKIERNILSDTEFFYNSTIKTLNQISEIYIERMDEEKPCAVTFIGTDEIEFREISYNQFIAGEKGKSIQKFQLGGNELNSKG
ncbi:MAG: hypothetical protein SVJ22_09235 [Halobacteriota archaeon]|nr:hypothetical protein [Halobacteriota archaeon]